LSAARASRSTERLVRWLAVERDEWSGRRIGKYRVLRRLSRGGMAELLLAQSAGTQGFSKLVVVKRILPRFAEEPEFIRMFLDEARLAATLSHPNVVSVFDIGREDTDYFFTMEYIHGVDLRALLDAARRSGERLPFDHAIWIGIGIAAIQPELIERTGRRIGYQARVMPIRLRTQAGCIFPDDNLHHLPAWRPHAKMS